MDQVVTVSEYIVIGVGDRLPSEDQVGGRLRRNTEILRCFKHQNKRGVILISPQIDPRARDSVGPGQIGTSFDVSEISAVDHLGISREHQVGLTGIDQDSVSVESRVDLKERRRIDVFVLRVNGGPDGVRRKDVIATARARGAVGKIDVFGVERDNTVIDVEGFVVVNTAAEELLLLGQRNCRSVRIF